jgi:hypothetical protein
MPSLIDKFTRSITAGWGTSDSYHEWAVFAGPAANWDINGANGTYTPNTPGQGGEMQLDLGQQSIIAGQYDWRFETAWVGNLNRLELFFRLDVPSSVGYRIRLENGTSDRVTLEFMNLSGVPFGNYNVVEPYTYGTWYTCKFYMYQHNFFVKTWDRSQIEPATWNMNVQNHSITGTNSQTHMRFSIFHGSSVINVFGFDNINILYNSLSDVSLASLESGRGAV